MMKLVEGKKKRYLVSLIEKLNYKDELEMPVDQMSDTYASILIDKLVKLEKKESNYYADKSMINTLVTFCKHPEIFIAFKSECLKLPEFVEQRRGNALNYLLIAEDTRTKEEVLQELTSVKQALEEALDQLNNDKLIDKLEKQEDRLTLELRLAEKLDTEKNPLIDKWNATVKGVDKMEKQLDEYKESITAWVHVRDIKLNNDIVKSFINEYASKYYRWEKEKATPDQVRTIINLEKVLQGDNVQIHYAETVSKKFATIHIKKLQSEIKLKFGGYEKAIARLHRHSVDNNKNNILAWDTENDNAWASLIFQLENVLGHTIDDIERDDLNALKPYVTLAKMDNPTDYIVDQLDKSDYSLSLRQLQDLGLTSARRLREVTKNVDYIKKQLEDMYALGYITEEDIKGITKEA